MYFILVQIAGKRRMRICWCLLAFAFVVSHSAAMLGEAEVHSAAECSNDYAIPTVSVEYAKVFAGGTLAPDEISMNGRALGIAATQNLIEGALRSAPIVIEDWRQRTDQQQCEYLLGLLRQHPDSMQLYKLRKLQLAGMSGIFRVCEWKLPGIGALRVFFYKSSATETEKSYLYYLTLVPIAAGDVKRSKGSSYILTRRGPPEVAWNVRRNLISMRIQADR
jgi:hypothetical protein